MSEINKFCDCKGCKEKRENEEKHLNHPFYAEANQYRETIRREQVLKGAAKYPNPFDPADWTAKELLQHAMQENVDQGHYIYGLFEKVEEFDKAYSDLLKGYNVTKNLYEREMTKMAELVELVMALYPTAGKVGDHIADISKKLINNLTQETEYWRQKAIIADKRANDLQNTMYETREF